MSKKKSFNVYHVHKTPQPAFWDWATKMKRGDTLPRGRVFKSYVDKKNRKIHSLVYIRDELSEYMQTHLHRP